MKEARRDDSSISVVASLVPLTQKNSLLHNRFPFLREKPCEHLHLGTWLLRVAVSACQVN